MVYARWRTHYGRDRFETFDSPWYRFLARVHLGLCPAIVDPSPHDKHDRIA